MMKQHRNNIATILNNDAQEIKDEVNEIEIPDEIKRDVYPSVKINRI